MLLTALIFQDPDSRFWRNCVSQNGPKFREPPRTRQRYGSVPRRACRGCSIIPSCPCPQRSFLFHEQPSWPKAAVEAAATTRMTVRGRCGPWKTTSCRTLKLKIVTGHRFSRRYVWHASFLHGQEKFETKFKNICEVSKKKN